MRTRGRQLEATEAAHVEERKDGSVPRRWRGVLGRRFLFYLTRVASTLTNRGLFSIAPDNNSFSMVLPVDRCSRPAYSTQL